MNDILNAESFNTVLLVILLSTIVVGLLVCFSMTRVCMNSSEQIALLESILDQHKRQTVLLLRLCKASEPENQKGCDEVHEQGDNFVRLFAER